MRDKAPAPRRTARGHFSPEAFCLMSYATDDNREMEAIWNSRDGVTPFIVHSSRSGREMRHVDWHRDTYNPNHVPRQGDRIFVDITPEEWERINREQIDRFWDHPEYPMSKHFATKEDALVHAPPFRSGEPMLIEVGPEGWQAARGTEAGAGDG
jgi:hypothetical protein